MRTKLVITLVIITLVSICSATVISHNVISSILQDIMSPAHTEKAMQLINMAATKANKNVAIPANCGLPTRRTEIPIVARNEPIRIVNNVGMPGAIFACDGPRLVTKEPRSLIGLMYPAQQKTIRQVVKDFPASNMVDLRQMYQTVVSPRENVGYIHQGSLTNPVSMVSSNAYVPVDTKSCYLSMSAPTANCLPVASNPYLPVSIPNPLLPATSPMSGMPPSFLPPPTQSKGQFLRKIPIPPPML